jgi:hypothetical protein
MEPTMLLHSQTIRRLHKWARGIVLVETGQPVELIHIEEIDGHSRAFVELPSGLRTHVAEAALTNRLARLSEGGLTVAGVAVAGMLLGYSLGLPEADRLALTAQTPASLEHHLVSPAAGRFGG